MKRIPISVTKENIAKGVEAAQQLFEAGGSGIACQCPIARAFTDAGFKGVCCGLFNVSYKGFKGEVRDGFAELPKVAMNFIDQLTPIISRDAENNLKPICFTITIP